jgi:hypothetical protein
MERLIKFRKALKEVFKDENGKLVLEFLKETYVEVPAIDKSTEVTFYKLGQKEFVQGLIKDVESDLPEVSSTFEESKL